MKTKLMILILTITGLLYAAVYDSVHITVTVQVPSFQYGSFPSFQVKLTPPNPNPHAYSSLQATLITNSWDNGIYQPSHVFSFVAVEAGDGRLPSWKGIVSAVSLTPGFEVTTPAVTDSTFMTDISNIFTAKDIMAPKIIIDSIIPKIPKIGDSGAVFTKS